MSVNEEMKEKKDGREGGREGEEQQDKTMAVGTKPEEEKEGRKE